MKTDEQVINVLWTGGWDSTYRIIELSRKAVTVQPIYVYGDGRASEYYERVAMQKILILLKSKKETHAKILPVNFVHLNSIPLNEEITEAYNNIQKETSLGSQHEWLGRLSYIYPGMEIGTEAGSAETSRIIHSIQKYGKLIKDNKSDSYILDPTSSTREGMLVLGNFRYPIIDKTELDMKRNIDTWGGYKDVMENIWFCHTPFYGKPCGICHPCEVKIESGMEHLLPRASLRRYNRKNKMPYKLVYKIERKLNNKLSRLKLNSDTGTGKNVQMKH